MSRRIPPKSNGNGNGNGHHSNGNGHTNGHANGNGHAAANGNGFAFPAASEESFSEDDRRRLHVIRQVMREWLTPEEAGDLLDLSARQVLRIVHRVRDEGESGIVHRLKGRASNHTYPVKFKERVLKLYQAKCAHLGPTAAHRLLRKYQKIRLNRETLRRWLVAAGLRAARV